MPTVGVPRDLLFQELGREYSARARRRARDGPDRAAAPLARPP